MNNTRNEIANHYNHSTTTNNNYNNNNSHINVVQQLINYIYSTVELSNFKYKLIEYEQDLTILTKQKHYVSANFNGSNCLLVFTKLRDKYYSFMIDRKTLSYNPAQIKIENVKIIPVNLRLDNSIYSGTIMDGIFIQNKRNRDKMYVITDIYYFRGRDMSNENIKNKITNVMSYLEATLKGDEKINNIKLTVNKLFEITDILNLKAVIEKSKNFDFKGYAFFPEKSGTKLIYLNNNESKSLERFKEKEREKENRESEKEENNEMNDNIYINTNIKTEPATKRNYRYITKTTDDVYAILEVRKTEYPDVYYVFCADVANENNKNVIKIKRLGIALIPDTNCSKLCKNIIAGKTNGRALMKCKFHYEKNKWIPIESDSTRKFPTLITEIEKYLDIIYDSPENDVDNNIET